MSAGELPIVLKLWAHDVPNSGMDTRGVPDEAADIIKSLVEALEITLSAIGPLAPGQIDDAKWKRLNDAFLIGTTALEKLTAEQVSA